VNSRRIIPFIAYVAQPIKIESFLDPKQTVSTDTLRFKGPGQTLHTISSDALRHGFMDTRIVGTRICEDRRDPYCDCREKIISYFGYLYDDASYVVTALE